MSKKTEPVKPLFPLKHEFENSLNRYIEATSALAEIVRTCLKHDLIDKKVVDMVQERLNALDASRYG